VVQRLYDPYLVTDGSTPIPLLEDAVPWSAQARADLQAMMARSQAQGEPILDFDPIIDAQDYQLSDVSRRDRRRRRKQPRQRARELHQCRSARRGDLRPRLARRSLEGR
jgi:hypothetical protein